MPRVSERISSAVMSVTCPGCGKRVVPTVMNKPPGAGPLSSEAGKRWSFIWRPPSGEVCPECFFPLQRLARRLVWVRTFSAGLVLLVAALMLTVLWLFNRATGWVGMAARVSAAVGAVLLVVGIGGIVLGGRSQGPAPPA